MDRVIDKQGSVPAGGKSRLTSGVDVASGGSERRWRVFVVDQHPIVHAGLKTLLGAQAAFEVCGYACDPVSALEAMRQDPPDVVMAEMMLPGRGGLDLIKDIRVQYPGIRILIYSGMDELLFAVRALRAGANGYIMKHESLQSVPEALARIVNGELVAAGCIAQQMMRRLGNHEVPDPASVEALSDREMQIFQLLAQSLKGRQIAARLNLSPKTFECHRSHIRQKLKCKTSAELLRLAMATFCMVTPSVTCGSGVAQRAGSPVP
jgi:DNA-binding NarL/FixJ family response regulator